MNNRLRRGRYIAHNVSLTWALLFFLAGGWIGAWAPQQFTGSPTDLSALGGFLSGTIGPLWSAASLLLVYAAYVSQRDQIFLQEQAVRDAVRNQQLAELEGRFFQIIGLHVAQTANIDGSIWKADTANPNRGVWLLIRGKRYLHNYYRHVQQAYEQRTGGVTTLERLRLAVAEVEAREMVSLDSYYASVVMLLMLIDRAANVDTSLSAYLADALLAQLSPEEATLIAYKFSTAPEFSEMFRFANTIRLFRYARQDDVARFSI